MTTIDHRILIPAAPDVVWNYVSDITHNPDWQVDCTDVIFLTSRREGPGLRWRYAAPGGHEMVIAVTAWYNGLGYEYYFVDGTPFRENKGRIRLQEIPEGTIVQWTFTYELGGLLGGMRNSLGMRRQIDQTISDSLKTLWQKIKQSSGSSRVLEPKSLMREAPDVEARSTYQPRHPSVVSMETPEDEKPLRLSPARLKIEPPISDDDAQSFPVIEEPPVLEDDTRPRSPFAPPAEPARPMAEAEPDFLDAMADDELARFEPPRTDASPAAEPEFLNGIHEEAEQGAVDLARFEPPRDPSDTQPRQVNPVESTQERLDTRSEYTEAVVEPRSTGEETEPLPAAQPESALTRSTEPEPTAEVNEQITTRSPVLNFDEETQPELDGEATVQLEDFNPLTDEKIADPSVIQSSSDASIWEIFGVQRPSETQETVQVEMENPDAGLQPEAEPEAPASVDLQPEAEAPAADITVPTLRPVAATLEVQPIPSRLGLRIIQRRKAVRLRRV